MKSQEQRKSKVALTKDCIIDIINKQKNDLFSGNIVVEPNAFTDVEKPIVTVKGDIYLSIKINLNEIGLDPTRNTIIISGKNISMLP